MHRDLHQRLQDALDSVSIVATAEGRDTLLQGIPNNVIDTLYRYPDNKRVDLTKLIEQLDRLAPLERDGTCPLIIFLENAQKTVAGTLTWRKLQDIIDELKQQDKEDISPLPPVFSLSTIPELNVFGGGDERLPYTFFTGALRVQKSIVCLRVPRIFGSLPDHRSGTGTGWIITPRLILTCYHVINARTPHEGLASPAEFRLQAEKTIAWFDYLTKETAPYECSCAELTWANADLDYALLRLNYPSPFEHREPLSLIQFPQKQYTASRLNIVQHPNGDPLQYAIRNNFSFGYEESSKIIRYLTHTENGASGSPVFNDDW